MGEEICGYNVPGATGEWTIRTFSGLPALYEQREVNDVPVVSRKGLHPSTPVWWDLFEVPRGMAARMPQMVALQGGQLMEEPLVGPYHFMLETLWAAERADVFVGSIRHHRHLWLLPLAMRSACTDPTTESLCSADPSVRTLVEAGVELLRLLEERESASWLQ